MDLQEILLRYPKRARSLLGLARSADAAGDHLPARETYSILEAIWEGADTGIAEMKEVRAPGHNSAAPRQSSGSSTSGFPTPAGRRKLNLRRTTVRVGSSLASDSILVGILFGRPSIKLRVFD